MIRSNMREIKFRVWDKSVMRWWSKDSQYLQMDGKKIHPAPWSTLSAELPDDDIIIEQYTGLKDSKGQEIYEGDIIKAIYPNAQFANEAEQITVVKWAYDRWAFNNKTAGFYFSCFFYPEVIGNIHENPELLEK